MKIHTTTYAVVSLLMLLNIEVCCQYKRLGSHSPPSKGATVLGGKFPPPQVFYHHFVKLGQPLLMKNVLNETVYPAFQKWTDDYLREKYGNEIVNMELGKKEDRDGKKIELFLHKFLDIYDKSDLYMIDSVPDSMKEEIIVPHSLHCGGFQNNLQDAALWFSAGETKSVLHYDSVDNINCLLDGQKKLVLIDRKYKMKIEEHGWVARGVYSKVDVDSVDPNEFPGIYHAAWYSIDMQKGDCVFIPYKWYHHVYSPPGRNLAVNLWFSHLLWFNTTDCKDFTSKEGKPLSTFPMASPNEAIRSDFVSSVEDNGDMSWKAFKADCGCKNEQDAEKLFEIINQNKDRKVSVEELYSFDMDEALRQAPDCFSIYKEDDDDDDTEDDDSNKENRENAKEAEVVRENAETLEDKSQTESDSVVKTESAENKNVVDTFAESLEKLVDERDEGKLTDDKDSDMEKAENKRATITVGGKNDDTKEKVERQEDSNTKETHTTHDEF